MPWNRNQIARIVRKVVGGEDGPRASRDERFRDEALPHLPAVARYALSLTRDEADADDLVQETFLRAYKAWDQFIPGTECRAWLFAICRNTYLRVRTREQKVQPYEDAELEALGAAAVHASASHEGMGDVWSSLDVIPAVHRAIDELPEPFREAVVLVDLEEQTYAEAAGVLGVPVGTVRSRLFRGRRLLQEQLIEYARDAGLAPRESDRADEGDHSNA